VSGGDPKADGAAGVDFVVGAVTVANLDEDLPGPDRPHLPALLHGSGRVVAAAVIGILGVVVAVRVATTHHEPSAAAAARAAASSAAAAVASRDGAASGRSQNPVAPATLTPPSAAPVEPIRLDPRIGVQNCPDVYACTVEHTVPAGVTAAVRASFPGARVRAVDTVYGRRDAGVSEVLLQRTVVVDAGRTRVTVDVHSRLPTDLAKAKIEMAGNYTTTYYRDIVPLYTVTVQARRQVTTAEIPLGTLAGLADSDGLLAT
jgi:hypothetical protein